MEIDVSKPFHFGFNSFDGGSEKSLVERSEYAGQTCLRLACTQLAPQFNATAQKRILEEWCEFFRGKSAVEELMVNCRTPVPLFESICEHRSIKRLKIKWGPVTDLSPLAKLKNLESLDLGTSGVKDLSPLVALKKLKYLNLDNFKQAKDFAALGGLRSLEFLKIVGYPQGPQKIHVRSVEFLRSLKKLRALAFEFVIFDQFKIDPLLTLKRLEFLEIPGLTEEDRVRLVAALPSVKYGDLVLAKPRRH